MIESPTLKERAINNIAFAKIVPEGLTKLRLIDDKLISFFKAPITNVYPAYSMSLREIAGHIKNSETLANLTKWYRDLDNLDDRRIFKKTELPYVTFAGTFKVRSNRQLIRYSNAMGLDFDNVDSPDKTKSRLANDTDLGALLIFTTISNHGLKVVVDIDLLKHSYDEWFEIFARYFIRTWGLVVDHTGKDLARASFLCSDPAAVINF